MFWLAHQLPEVRSSLRLKHSPITSTLGVLETIVRGKCLGLPPIVGRRKKQVFSFIKDRNLQEAQSLIF